MSGSQIASSNSLIPLDTVELVYIPPARSAKIARYISDFLSPPVLAAASLIMVALFAGSALVWKSICIFLSIAVVLPTLYVFWLVRKKFVSDFHMPIRSQRIRPMIFMMVSGVVSVIALIQLHPPRFLIVIGLAACLQLIVIFVITLKWKISGHAAAVSTFSALCILLFGSLAGYVFVLIPVVIWARLRLKRHTPMQTLAGTILGLVTLLIVVFAC